MHPLPLYLLLPTHDGDKLPWLCEFEEARAGYHLIIPDTGGHSQIAKVPAQEDWMENLLSDVPGVKKTWHTVWELESQEVMDHVLTLLRDSGGGRIITAKKYMERYSVLRARLFKRWQKARGM